MTPARKTSDVSIDAHDLLKSQRVDLVTCVESRLRHEGVELFVQA